MSMSLNVNIHHPAVAKGPLGVYRNPQGDLVVALNDTGAYDGTVILFATDSEWQAIVEQVESFRTTERVAKAEKMWEELCPVCGDTREWCDIHPYPSEHDDEQRYPSWMEQGPGTENP